MADGYHLSARRRALPFVAVNHLLTSKAHSARPNLTKPIREWGLETSTFVFANREGEPYVSTSINHLHRNAYAPMIEGKRRQFLPGDFVLHSLRHTMLTRLGESGVDAFTIMRIAGHNSVVVSQRYIHLTPEAVEPAFERLQLFGKGPEIESKRQLPATVSATSTKLLSVSH